MSQRIISFFDKLLTKNKVISNFLINLFDIGSKITSIFLFHLKIYILLILILYFIPLFYPEDFMNFLIALTKITNLYSAFLNLPLI